MISIIVPVYKVEPYLKACILSILRQTCRDFELILVDDGSPDQCGMICDNLAQSDSRIRVIHQQNGGVSRARNAGIDAAGGEWIAFIDSDDLVTPRFLAAFRVRENHTSDLVIQGWRNLKSGHLGEKYRFTTQHYNSLKAALTLDILTFRGPVCKLFKKSLIEHYHLRFPEGLAYAEDAVFYYTYLSFCSSIQTYNSCRYLYRHDREESASRICHDPFTLWQAKEKCLSLLRLLFEMCNLKSPYPSQADLVELKGMFHNLFHHYPSYSDFTRFLRLVRSSEYFKIRDYKPNNLRNTIFSYCVRFLPNRLAYLILNSLYS